MICTTPSSETRAAWHKRVDQTIRVVQTVTARLPDRFSLNDIPSCPVRPHERALFELLPTLIQHGLDGKFISFGSCPEYYGIGNDPWDAELAIVLRYQNQKPLSPQRIDARQLESEQYRAFVAWKASKGRKCLDAPDGLMPR